MSFIVEITGLTRTYHQAEETICAVNNANIQITKGEFVAIVGKSGSGKTTLLNLIGCVDRPEKGTITIDGIDVTSRLNVKKLPEIRRKKIGYIFQDFNLVPILSAEENIIFPVMLDNQKVDKAYLQELVDFLGISARLSHFPSQLSGGQKQRVAIARALINRPSILLADEPTGNLDAKSADEIMVLLKRVNEKGNTVLLVTHNESYANMCHRKITINDGVIS